MQRLHSNTPPCVTHAIICASREQVGPADVVEDGKEKEVVAELEDVVVGELVLGVSVVVLGLDVVTSHFFHLHLFSY